MSNYTLERFRELATTAERKELANTCGTSMEYLFYHVAKGRREPNPALAARIEEATIAMARSSKGRLPVVYRTEMNTACRGCKFAIRCLGDKAIAAEFEVLGE